MQTSAFYQAISGENLFVVTTVMNKFFLRNFPLVYFTIVKV